MKLSGERHPDVLVVMFLITSMAQWGTRRAGGIWPEDGAGKDYATPVGSRWRLPLGLELMGLCCCPVGFLLEEKPAGSNQTSNQCIHHVGTRGIKALRSMCTSNKYHR